MAEVQIISMIDGVRDFPVRVDKKTVKVLSVHPGRNHFEEADYEKLLENKGFKKLLEIDSFREPETGEVKSDSEKLQLQKEHAEAVEKLESDLADKHKKEVSALRSAHKKEVEGLKSQLKNTSESLIDVTGKFEKAKSELEILKKGAKKQ